MGYLQESDLDYEIEDEFGIDPESGEVMDFGGLQSSNQNNEQTEECDDPEHLEGLQKRDEGYVPASPMMESKQPYGSSVDESLSIQKGLGAPPASSEVHKVSAESAISEVFKLQVSKSFPLNASSALCTAWCMHSRPAVLMFLQTEMFLRVHQQEVPTWGASLEEASPTCSSGVRGVKDVQSDEEPIKVITTGWLSL